MMMFGRPNLNSFLMFVFFASFAVSTAVGIDLGHENVRVSLISKEKPLHWAINSDGDKITPTYFALWNMTRSSNYNSTESWNNSTMDQFEWAFGERAKDQCQRFPKLCLNGYHFNNETHFNLRGYERTALSIIHLMNSIRQAENINDTIRAVVALPPGMKAREKSFLFAALSMSGIATSQFIESSAATAELFALEKSSSFKNSSKIVAFADFGAVGSRISIFRFEMKNGEALMTQLASEFEESTGGNLIDRRLADLIAPMYNVSLDDPKTRVNFMDDIRQVKEALSVHRSVDLKWEADDDDEEKIITVTRDDLHSVASSMNITIKAMISIALARAHVDHVDRVEIIGGCSRIPFIQELLKTGFNVSELGKSLNADSAVAFGAGYISAKNSPEFNVRNVTRSVFVTSPASVKTENQLYRIFNKGDLIDVSPVINCVVNPKQVFTLLTDDPGKPFMAFTLNITKPTQVEITFIHNYYLMPLPYEAVSTDGTVIDIEYETVGWELSQAELNASNDKVQTLVRLQKERRETEKMANQLEERLLLLHRLADTSEILTADERALLRQVAHENFLLLEDAIRPGNDFYHEILERVNSQTEDIVNACAEHTAKTRMLEKLKKTAAKAVTLMNVTVNAELARQMNSKLADVKRVTDNMADGLNSTEIGNLRQEVKDCMQAIENIIEMREL